jgi:hypothetical protein
MKNWKFPPEVFWITPDGEVRDIIGHLTAMQEDPASYGFSFPPITKSEISRAFDALLLNRWVRGRLNGDKALFQVWSANNTTIGNIAGFLMLYRPHIKTVVIETGNPYRIWELKPIDIIEDRVLFNPKKKTRKKR